MDALIGKPVKEIEELLGKPTSMKPSENGGDWSYAYSWYSPSLMLDFKDGQVLKNRCFKKT